MEINWIEGFFGALEAKRLELHAGLNIVFLENEGGKSTWSAFIRTMLYGINTSKRDTKTVMSDKTKYQPLSGKPLSGTMSFTLPEGKEIILKRSTGKSGPFSEFSAYEKESGQNVLQLTAKNTGRQLFGIGEDSFINSCFIDGCNLSMLPTEEFEAKILSLSGSGDSMQSYTKAMTKLDRQRLDLKSSSSKGLYPETLKKLEDCRASLEKAQELAAYRQNIIAEKILLTEDIEKTREDYNQLMSSYTLIMGEQNLPEEIEEALLKKNIDALKENLSTEAEVKEAMEFLYAYEGASLLEKERRAQIPTASRAYENALGDLTERQQIYEELLHENNRPKVRLWSLALAFLFGIAGMFTMNQPLGFSLFGIEIPYVLSFVAIVCLVITFIGNGKPKEEPQAAFDMEKEKKKLESAFENVQILHRQSMQAVNENYDKVLEFARRFDGSVQDIQSASAVIKTCEQQIWEYKNQYTKYKDAQIKAQLARGAMPDRSEEFERVTEKNVDLQNKNAQLHNLIAELAATEDRLATLGKIEDIFAREAKLREKVSRLEEEQQAIELAKQVLEEVNAELSGRISPEIARLCGEYFAEITDNRHKEVIIKQDFALLCDGGEAGAALFDLFRLSSGTRDQLYLALRLAVCQVLHPEGSRIPLILDDPFLTFDKKRTEAALALLQRLSAQRQIVLFTGKRLDVQEVTHA